MRNYRFVVLAGASLFAVTCGTGTAWAQDKAPEAAQAAPAAADDPNIVVTARRKEEALLDVPATVSAVTGKQIEDYQLTKFQDLSQVVSGLQLQTQQLGFGATASVRGVTFQVTSQGSPTVGEYLNEVPLEPNHMAQSNYDIGQVEVLKGPQGTLRGQSSPSGSIIETTRRPDLQEVGGYVTSDVTSLNAYNVQGAIGVPLIKDVLGIRVAGVWDVSDAGGVSSAVNHSLLPSNPRQRTWSARATVRFEPSSNFSTVVMYQKLVDDQRTWGGILFGPGTAGIAGNFRAATASACSGLTNCGNPAVYAPPGFNGPPLTAAQMENVADFPTITNQHADLVTAQADWRFAGQKLSFIGSYQHFVVNTGSDSDSSNTIVGTQAKFSHGTLSTENRQSYELRLASDQPLLDGLLDYTVGGFYLKLYGNSTSEGANAILMQGAFGSPLGGGMLPGGGFAPGTLSPYTYDPRYVVGYNIVTPRDDQEKSIFGTLTFHLFGDSTEFSAGGRQIFHSLTKEVDVDGEPGLAAILNPNGLGPCPAQITSGTYLTGGGTITGSVAAPIPVVGQTYAGTCNVAVNLGNNNGGIVTPGVGAPASIFNSIPNGTARQSAFVYNFSLSHKFSPDLMVYATYGTAWRAGPGPITAAPACSDPTLCGAYNILNDENSKAIEAGFKGAFFDRKLDFSVAAYRESYSGLFVLGSGATYLPSTCIPSGSLVAATSVTNSQVCNPLGNISSGGFTFNAPTTTYGVDVEASFRFSKDFNAGVLFSWAHGQYNNAKIPCRDTNLDGIPDTGTLPTVAAWILGVNTTVVNGVTVYSGPTGPRGPTLCVSNGSSSTAPPWNLVGHAEYSHEVFGSNFGGKAFIRGLVNYSPKNTNIDPSQAGIVPNQYALVNLWVGLRGIRGNWEFSLSAKNLFNNQTVLSQGLQQGTLITPQRSDAFGTPGTASIPSGYTSISFVPRREFALNFRYDFGSR